MIQVREIQSKIEALQSGKVLPWEFYEWLQDASWNMRRDSSPEAVEMAASAKLIFNDYDQRIIEKSELFRQLAELSAGSVSFEASEAVTVHSGMIADWVFLYNVYALSGSDLLSGQKQILIETKAAPRQLDWVATEGSTILEEVFESGPVSPIRLLKSKSGVHYSSTIPASRVLAPA